MIKKELLSVLGFFIAIYAIICWHLYMSQEGMIFFPQKLHKSYKFNFDQNFDEIKIKMKLLLMAFYLRLTTQGDLFFIYMVMQAR